MKKLLVLGLLCVSVVMGGCGTTASDADEIEFEEVLESVAEQGAESESFSEGETPETDGLEKVGEIGYLQKITETVYSTKKPEVVAGTLDLQWLVVDSSYPGADSINAVIQEEMDMDKGYLYDNASMFDEYEDFEMPAFSFTSNMSESYYMDGRYLSFVQENYDYTGGAHGMPYWNGHTFDLETGAQLSLADIVSQDEDALKEIVSRYFADIFAAEPDAYFSDAREVILDCISLDADFYLSDEGIVFFYTPYTLAPYAGGFSEVLVPYSEFDLKIELK